VYIDTKLYLFPVIIIYGIEVLKESIAHQKASFFWMILVFARSDVYYTGFYICLIFNSVYVVFEICLRVQQEHALVEYKLDWLKFRCNCATHGVVKVAYINLITFSRSSGTNHVYGMIILHFGGN